MKKLRELNIELLRIVAMFMVLLLHANYWSLGSPSIGGGKDSSIRIFLESLCMPCVNLFIMISGWFGIKVKLRSFVNLVFQCLFIAIVINVSFAVIDPTLLSTNWLLECMYLTHTDYFVKAYILLCLVSPLLNAFADNSTEETYRNTLISLLVFQFLLGWVFQLSQAGRLLHFMTLYMLARYMRLHQPRFICYSKTMDIIIFLSSTSLLFLFYIIPMYTNHISGSIEERFCSYVSPFCIISSVFLFAFFTKMRVNKRYSNLILFFSSSSFAVYLVNLNYNIQPYFKNFFISLHEYYIGNIALFWPVAIVSLLMFFVVCVFLDKLRILIYNNTFKMLFDKSIVR